MQSLSTPSSPQPGARRYKWASIQRRSSSLRATAPPRSGADGGDKRAAVQWRSSSLRATAQPLSGAEEGDDGFGDNNSVGAGGTCDEGGLGVFPVRSSDLVAQEQLPPPLYQSVPSAPSAGFLGLAMPMQPRPAGLETVLADVIFEPPAPSRAHALPAVAVGGSGSGAAGSGGTVNGDGAVRAGSGDGAGSGASAESACIAAPGLPLSSSSLGDHGCGLAH